jgi:hypothetical protein
VVGGGATGRAAAPEEEYSQMSAPPVAIGVALGGWLIKFTASANAKALRVVNCRSALRRLPHHPND